MFVRHVLEYLLAIQYALQNKDLFYNNCGATQLWWRATNILAESGTEIKPANGERESGGRRGDLEWNEAAGTGGGLGVGKASPAQRTEEAERSPERLWRRLTSRYSIFICTSVPAGVHTATAGAQPTNSHTLYLRHTLLRTAQLNSFRMPILLQ